MWVRSLDKLRFEVQRRAAMRLLASPVACRFLAGSRTRPRDGRRISPDVAAMLRVAELSGMAPVSSLTPHNARRDLAHSVALCAEPRARDIDSRTLSFAGPHSQLRVRMYGSRGLRPMAPAILYLHGGGWVTGDVDVYDVFCGRLAAETRSLVFSLDYRLAPEHQFPAQPDDCLAAWRWLGSQADTFGFDPARVAVAGDSAGGSLSALVVHESARDGFRPALQVLIYPSLDATFAHPSHESMRDGFFLTRASIDWYLRHYAGRDPDRRHPRLSPLLAPGPLPNVPALIYSAGFDPLRDEANAYASRIRGEGTAVCYREFTDLVHGFALMAGIAPGAKRATDEMRRTTADVLHAPHIGRAIEQLRR